MTLDTRRLSCIADMRAFLAGSDALQFQSPDPAGRRQWLADLLRRFHYQTLPRTDKGTLRAFAQKVGGCSRAQLTRLIAQWLKTGHLTDRRGPQPDGQPGYLRVDSVNQGDFEGIKGVYVINVVDAVSQNVAGSAGVPGFDACVAPVRYRHATGISAQEPGCGGPCRCLGSRFA